MDSNKNKKPENLQAELETELRENLLKNPSEENFKIAYDKIHSFFLKETRRKELYSSELRWFSNIFLKKISTGKKVLDIGSGNGKLALALAQNKNEVVGIDISSIALEMAENKLEKLNRDQTLSVSFKYGDARVLDFPDQTFDFVVSHDLIEHLTENDFLPHLSEVERVLKIGGSYLFWTPSRLLSGTSYGLHLKEYTVQDMVKIIKQKNFKQSWIDARFFKLKLIVEIPQSLLFLVILYEKLIEIFIKFVPQPFKKIFVAPLFFCLTKSE